MQGCSQGVLSLKGSRDLYLTCSLLCPSHVHRRLSTIMQCILSLPEWRQDPALEMGRGG